MGVLIISAECYPLTLSKMLQHLNFVSAPRLLDVRSEPTGPRTPKVQKFALLYVYVTVIIQY